MPAFLLSPLGRYLIIGVVIAALTGWAIWERHDAIAAAKGEKAAVERADLAEQDAKRWHDASDLRDGSIAILTSKLKEQDTAISKLQFAREQADLHAAEAEATARDARAAFDQRMQEIEAEARAHPDQVVPVGAIVRGRVGQLWE